MPRWIMNSTFNLFYHDGKWEELNQKLCSQLIQLDSDYFVRPWPKASWEQLLVDSGREFQLTLLMREGLVLGFVLFLVEKEDERAHLVKILCHPDIRGQGLGQRLLSESQVRLVSKFGVSLLDLEVEASNTAALGLYQKLGYKKMRDLKDLYGNSLHGVAMQAKAKQI